MILSLIRPGFPQFPMMLRCFFPAVPLVVGTTSLASLGLLASMALAKPLDSRTEKSGQKAIPAQAQAQAQADTRPSKAAPLRGASTGEDTAAAETTPTPPAGAELPQYPSQLYAKLSENTRPQWRQHYRATVTRCLEGRQQAAMGLGAVTADLFLAAQARDSQQIRNLLQDEETIEKTLGLVDSMASLRTAVLGAAESSDWPGLQQGIEKLSAGHRRHLRGQKDEPLADLAYIGQWLRALQTCHAVVNAKAVPDQQLAIGDPALVAEMTRRLNALSNAETESNRCLRLLHKRLAGLAKLWPQDGSGVPDPADRLRRSTELLSDTVGQLLQDESPAPAGTAVAPKP